MLPQIKNGFSQQEIRLLNRFYSATRKNLKKYHFYIQIQDIITIFVILTRELTGGKLKILIIYH